MSKDKQPSKLKQLAKDKFIQGAHEFHAILEQGSSELANMTLHGHPAPIYNHSMSPAEPSTEAPDTVHGKATMKVPEVETGQAKGVLDSLVENAQAMSQDAPEKDMSMER